ncbi:hypothetical protein BKA56DRAFT_296894 [Ilyonectria sp. MPI-CAGE-AT-0026]|nr:hypothetical protein BKA56DRAFT_296894 [Ilyonectria sp. MPI-CAGE-AT-0026]
MGRTVIIQTLAINSPVVRLMETPVRGGYYFLLRGSYSPSHPNRSGSSIDTTPEPTAFPMPPKQNKYSYRRSERMQGNKNTTTPKNVLPQRSDASGK